jgi:DNA repair exonuclease SbcCD ATPase subunit
MKKVVIKNMHLVNFRGHKDLEVNFSDQTTISGDNRLGKSTIFDAFIWTLFGKDQFDRKDFEIIPIVDNKQLDRVDSEVSCLLDVDGREFNLKRILHQKWVRRRGTSEEVFDGCETLFYINDVPLKAGEYKARVDMIIEESLFKLITNPSVFMAMHWTKQREFLFNIAGTVSDVEALDKMATVSNKDAIFNLTNILNSGKSLVEYKKEISARKKKLKSDLEDIQPKIDQTTRLMPEAIDVDLAVIELSKVEVQIKGIDEQLSDRAKALQSQYDSIHKKQANINILKTKQQAVVNEATRKAQQDVFEAKSQREAIERNVIDLKRKVDDIHSSVSTIEKIISGEKSRLNFKEVEIDTLRILWNDENEKEYTAKAGCLICPVFNTECSDPLATEKHIEAQEKAKTAFFESKQKRVDEINAKGIAASNELEDIKTAVSKLEENLIDERNSLANAETEYIKAKEKLEKYPIVTAKQVIASEIPEWQELDKQIKDIEATIQNVESQDNSDLTSKKAELNQHRDELKKQLSSQETIGRYKDEIKRLELSGKDLAQQIADIESQEFTIDDFNRIKIDECDSRVNRMFEIVKFKLFDKTNDGNEFEACIALNKSGVPIAVTNTAEKINAGLDIIRTLSNFYNVSAPVFIDNSEAVNSFIHIDTQMVNLVVTKEKSLTIK